MTDSDRAVVEQSRGVLMLRYGVGCREALAVLDRWARESCVPLPEVAEALVEGVCQGRVTPETEGTVRWLEQRLRGAIDGVRDAGDEVPLSECTAIAATAIPVARPEPAAVPRPRQWRYTSAVHAARVLRSR